MLLDDEEIKKAVHKGDDHGFAGEVIGYGYEMLEEVAKAQLKKVVESGQYRDVWFLNSDGTEVEKRCLIVPAVGLNEG